MKIFLEKVIFVNRAPFDKLELDFSENEIAVLSSVNGKGKTTILSHIVDAFYEMARPHFPQEFEDKENKLYRVSSTIHNLDQSQPSFVYLRFKAGVEVIDYVDIRNNCTQEQYDEAIEIESKIPFSNINLQLYESNYAKIVSPNFDKKLAEQIFLNNILTYFPSYRYEQPGYLNDPYKINLDFNKISGFSGYLKNPIEVISGLPKLTNWIMDIVLDLRMNSNMQNQTLFQNINSIITQALISKKYGNLRFGVGLRGFGSTRIQILENKNGVDEKQIYPTIFNLSSGESALLCLFGELLRQADNNKNNIQLLEITGIVLIDEVDKHLHIKLQKEILPKLFNLFPSVQFIVTSHSPFLSMGLAEEVQIRSKIIDLDSGGISKDPTTNELYTEVYNMMISENERFKKLYESINNQIDNAKKLQIVTEGDNAEHIKKAIQILDKDLLNSIKIIKDSSDKRGQQLKNAFDVMATASYAGKFLFVWDCDLASLVSKIEETDNFKKFCFAENNDNTKARDKGGKAAGIENLYSDDYFTEDVYDEEETIIGYGGSKTEKKFNKKKFLQKIKEENTPATFDKYKPLIDDIKELINPSEGNSETPKS